MKRSLLISAAFLSGMAMAQTYCTPAITNGCSGTIYEFISNVTVSNVNNNSGCTLNPAYTDYSSTVSAMQLAAGGVYPVTVSISNSWSTDYVYLMLDVDANGTFDTTTGEMVGVLGPLTVTGGTQVLAGNLTMPAVVAANTRLRVRLSYGALGAGLEGCAAGAYGETEDYAVSTGGGPLTPEYQVNQANCTHDIDGIQGAAFAAAQVTRCANAVFNVNLGSPLVGMPFDVLISPIALVPVSGGALWTGTQSVNINLAAFSWAFGGFTTPFFGTVSLPISLPSPVDFYTQMAIIDGTNVDGVTLSQANGLHIVAGASLASYVPPTGDDAVNALPTPACMTFYGQPRNNVWVTTNGRIGFGAAMNATYTPTVAAALTGDAFVGYWSDLNVIAPASITATNPGPGISRFQWNNVVYYGTTIPNNFGIQFDDTVNTVQIDVPAAGGMAAHANIAFLGLSNAGGGSSDPGSIVYTGGSGFGAAAPNPGMVYNLAARGTGMGTFTTILYVWNGGTGNYDWVAF